MHRRATSWILVSACLLAPAAIGAAEPEIAVAVMEFASKGGIEAQKMDARRTSVRRTSRAPRDRTTTSAACRLGDAVDGSGLHRLVPDMRPVLEWC